MPAPNPYQRLLDALQNVGVRLGAETNDLRGFPLVLDLAAWPPVVLDVPEPGFLSLFDPQKVGVAVVGVNGEARALWGLAKQVPELASPDTIADSQIGALVEEALSGKSSSVYLNRRRFHANAVKSGASVYVLILVVEAEEEARAREASQSHQASALALKRIGKVLSSKQSIRSLSLAALHAIFGSYELSAALLWVRLEEDGPLALQSSIGTTRSIPGLSLLKPDYKCIANLAAKTMQPMRLDDVAASPLTSAVEAKICAPNAGPALVLPLISTRQLIGVLELVAKAGDRTFAKDDEIFETIAEHLALAIHNAMMFEENERLAMNDSLTGIANHGRMQEFLAKRTSEARRTGEKFAAIMVDVDHFRRFNEEEGHEAGDQVLRLVAKELRRHIRDYDLAARYGGEEFTLILCNADSKAAFEVAERCRGAIAALPNVSHTGEPRPITASFGCAVYPDSAVDAPGLLKAADQALYEAKRGGRNRTVVSGKGPKGWDLGGVA